MYARVGRMFYVDGDDISPQKSADAEPTYDHRRAVVAALGLRVRVFHERDHAGCLEIAATKHGEGTRLLTGREDATGAA